MSRRGYDYVWYQYFHCALEAICPVCETRKMIKDNHQSWNREHIRRTASKGHDTYPNLIPICRSCNLGMGKRCESTFEFMAEKLKKITLERAFQLLKEHDITCDKFDPICEQTQKNGLRCHNLKGGKNEIWCWKHINEGLVPMDCSELESDISEVHDWFTI